MKNLIASIKKINFSRVVTVCFASLLLFVATACSGGSQLQAKTLDTGNKPAPEQYVPKNAVTNPREGGMNQYSDVDPRANTTAAEAKAKGLIDNAEQNLNRRTGNPATAIKRAVNDAPNSAKEVGQNAKQGAESLSEKVQGTAEDFAQGTKRGMYNIKANSSDAAQDVKMGAKDAAGNVKEGARDFAKGTQRAADKLGMDD